MDKLIISILSICLLFSMSCLAEIGLTSKSFELSKSSKPGLISSKITYSDSTIGMLENVPKTLFSLINTSQFVANSAFSYDQQSELYSEFGLLTFRNNNLKPPYPFYFYALCFAAGYVVGSGIVNTVNNYSFTYNIGQNFLIGAVLGTISGLVYYSIQKRRLNKKYSDKKPFSIKP